MITEGSCVAIGIDAAVVANHHVAVRRPEAGRPGEVVDDFVVAPTLAGMDGLGERLAKWPGGDRRGGAHVDDLAPLGHRSG